MIQDNNLIESRQHIWDLVHKLDDYSLEMLFSELDIEYNISYIFSSDIDVRGFAKCINRNPNIKDLVENIISQIHLKSAIEIIETHSIIPQRNADDILFTLLKETDIAEHTALLADIDEKISNSTFKSDLDNILLGVAKYRANDSIEHLINSLDFEIKKSNMELTYNRNKIKLIVEELNDIQYKIGKNKKIKIQEFLKKLNLLVEK